jgi:hypothetical protein
MILKAASQQFDLGTSTYPVTSPGDGLNATFQNLAEATAYAALKNAACPGAGFVATTGGWYRYNPVGELPYEVIRQSVPYDKRILLPNHAPWTILAGQGHRPLFWSPTDCMLWAPHQEPGTQCQGELVC